MTTDPVLQTVALEFLWPTIDPFLFCAHHDDAYPAGNPQLGPQAALAGRELGQDFSRLDGWSMYHGQVVPGFPQHPHRGFETVTFVRRGLIDHSDSLGAAARFGRGDVQWLTAGAGVVHAEMFPLLDQTGPNPLELFQIWLNLPAEDKLVDPHFTMLWAEDIPRHVVTTDGRSTEVTVIAGELAGLHGPPPPPRSWAARPESDLAIWHIRMEPGARWELPPATGTDTVRTLYVFEGTTLRIADHDVAASTAAVLRADQPVALVAGDTEVECLLLQGRPIGEPVAQHGPYVMNDRRGIEQAFADYPRPGFGGWPWSTDDPVHDAARGRFARHADGRVDDVAPAESPAPH
jgi:redox-sensitive bicupin YhaK (pirin superfamily)